MNPRTRLAASRGPYAPASRLDVRTTNGGGPSTASCAGDLEPLDVGQADVEQDEVGSKRAGGRETRQSVRGLADDVEAVRREQRARLDAEAGGVIDDEDGVHGAIVAGATTHLLQGYPGRRKRRYAPPSSGSTLSRLRVNPAPLRMSCVRVPP